MGHKNEVQVLKKLWEEYDFSHCPLMQVYYKNVMMFILE